MLIDGIADLAEAGHDLCVVGSGPVGLALATDLAKRGRRVLLLESGGQAADAGIQSLAQAELADPLRHDDMMVATARRLGGTSNLWGARCIPYDPIDFEYRDWVGARWPIDHDEMARWLPAAVAATRSGAPVYREAIPGVAPADPRFACDWIERWANRQQAQAIHAEAIASDPLLEVRTHATLVDILFAEGGQVTAIDVADSRSGERVRVPVGRLVLAAGGVETARLLLAAQRTVPERFGGVGGPLGRYYMGHVVGEIADITFADPAADAGFQFRIDAHGSYVRNRIVAAPEVQRAHRLLNTAFWPVVPRVAEAEHGSAILSMVYLAMRWGPIGRRVVAEAIRRKQAPLPAPPLWPHVRNLMTGAPAATAFAADFFRRRHDRATRLPGFFVRNRAHRYGLSFHGEQVPDPESRVVLSGESDRLGLPRLRIDLRFGAQDADSVVRTHDLLEDWLARTGIGRLDYRMARGDRTAAVLAEASHGTHQVGLVRMGADRRDAIVDRDLRCFDAPNLHVASTAVLPSAGHANPTLTAVALALRLSAHLAQKGRDG